MFAALFLVYWSWFPTQDFADLMRQHSMTVRERSRFANAFFVGFMAAQFSLVALVTPLYLAGSFTEQKEHKTFDYLLITDLSDREIVMGTLGARLAKLFLLVLTGLPVLTLLEFLGGVDRSQVVAGFIAALVLMGSLGSASILVSVHARTTLRAVAGSYLLLLPFLVCTLLIQGCAGTISLGLVPNRFGLTT